MSYNCTDYESTIWIRNNESESFYSEVNQLSLQCCNKASKIFVLQRFLAGDPSSSSSLVHFKLSKNLQSFEDFRPKILKIFGIKSLFVEEILMEN